MRRNAGRERIASRGTTPAMALPPPLPRRHPVLPFIRQNRVPRFLFAGFPTSMPAAQAERTSGRRHLADVLHQPLLYRCLAPDMIRPADFPEPLIKLFRLHLILLIQTGQQILHPQG